MALDEIFDFGPPVTEAEIQECRHLLTAVIEHAPILRNMSIPGFRNTFLLRKGQLSARDGMRLLRVERETYDVVLDRFPWSVNWLKLPWMEFPMHVGVVATRSAESWRLLIPISVNQQSWYTKRRQQTAAFAGG
jgi:Contractile injection system tape measure protein